MKGVNIGPGILALRIKAKKIPFSRGVCNVDIYPVFLPNRIGTGTQLSAHEKFSKFVFDFAGFKLKMTPGDFFLLGPKKHLADQMTLARLCFGGPMARPTVRIFLFVCAGIG